MYDYGARMLIPDLGRWGAMDSMSEKYSAWSPYNYAINNPVMVIDPDGNDVINTGAGMTATGADAQFAFKAYVATMSTSSESSGNYFTEANFNRFMNGDDDDDDPPGNKLSRFRTKTANWVQENIRGPLSGWFDTHTRNAFVLDAEGQARMDDLRGQMSGYIRSNVGGGIKWGAEHGLIGSGMGTGHVGAFGKASKALEFTIAEAKFNYFFGKVTTGDIHNIQRSAQNLKDLGTLGIKSEDQLMKIFSKALAEGTELKSQSNKFGTTVTKFIEIGKKGKINVAFFYEGGNMATKPKVTTLIPQIYK
ncbi:RHS repeat-associated protein [Chryseobacterium sp. CBTAP 102]|nr:RHS repeat-associated protein [Chryseobacterium sp. CBTAP 102]